MSKRSSFVEPGDRAEIGDEVVYHADHGNLVRGLVAERAVSPLSNTMRLTASSTSHPRCLSPTPASGSLTRSFT